MASFDFIDSAASGYRFAWDNRGLVLRLAALPVLTKTASLALVFALGWQDNILRQGLIFIPATFMEGWMIAVCVRMAMFGIQESLLGLQRPLLGATLVYVLVQMMLSLAAGLAMGPLEQLAPHAPEAGDSASMMEFLASLAILATTVWLFRLFWLHIPVVMDISMQQFLQHIRSYFSSLQMMGIWVVTLVPPGMVLIIVVQLLNAPFGGSSANTPLALIGLNFFLQSLFAVLIAVIGNVAMAYGIRSALQGAPDRKVF
ncbi:MAG: hypothetical protein L6Q57_01695 [Alphaproteobacteria bacterium]|nr:hypothetical protein [Alphaproteobacteria bacterium]